MNLMDIFITGIMVYGPLMIALALFFAGLGLPLPGTVFVLVTGSLIQQGMIGGTNTLLCALLGVVLGDTACYFIGYFAKDLGKNNIPILARIFQSKWVTNLFTDAKQSSLSRFAHIEQSEKAQETFCGQEWMAIYLTRFLLTPFAVPTTLIVGRRAYPISQFLLADILGELSWLLLYGGLGYAFSDDFKLIGEWISDLNGLLVGIILLATCIYLMTQRRKE